MADGSNPQLVITERWDLATNRVVDIKLRIIEASAVGTSVGEVSGVGETAGVSDALQRAEHPPKSARTSATDFEAACKSHLGSNYEEHKDWLLDWHDGHIGFLEGPAISAFMAELGESVTGTPPGPQRRSAGPGNSDFETFRSFLERLYRKCKTESEDV